VLTARLGLWQGGSLYIFPAAARAARGRHGEVVGKEHVTKGSVGQGSGRIRLPRAVLAILAVLLLALGAAALASSHGSAEHGIGPLSAYWWLFALAALAIGLFTLVKLRDRIASTEVDSTAQARLNRGVLAVLAVLTVALPVALYFVHYQAPSQSGACPQCVQIIPTGTVRDTGNPLNLPTKAPTHPDTFRLPLGGILMTLGGLLAVLVIVGFIVLYLRLRNLTRTQDGVNGAPPLSLDDAVDEAALGDAVLAGRDALAGEARAAIIACYAAMEDSLAAAGVTRLASDSPADLLTRATERGVVDGPAPRLLAALFREARFSTHPMSVRHLDQARGALDEITAQLTARQEATNAAAAASGGPGPEARAR
jgi:predicted secreted protein